VGSALARALSAAGYAVGPVWSRTPERAAWLANYLPDASVVETPSGVAKGAALVIAAVPDRAIAETVGLARWCAGTAVVHTSGGTPVAALAPAYGQGAATGGWHPLKSFAGGPDDADLRGIAFAVEAEDELRDTLHEMTAALGGTAFDLPAGARARYHASAALASNGLVALLAEAAGLWRSFGVDRAAALTALLPLVWGTVQNLESLGLPVALTGPVERGDRETVAAHLAALGSVPAAEQAYRTLSARAVKLAEEKGGISGEEGNALRALLGVEGCGAVRK
jgi:predicted short-subunit dehydrogenase-like oxidoreductase (DUF2520 family)